MKRIVALKALRSYWEMRPETEVYPAFWYKAAKRSTWTTPADVKRSYANATILKDGRVVFNIMGNKHRLVVRINYQRGWIFIRFVGTHKEYDKIDAEKI